MSLPAESPSKIKAKNPHAGSCWLKVNINRMKSGHAERL